MDTAQFDALRAALLTLDDPFYHNTFRDAADEDEWWQLNERYVQNDLQPIMPAGLTTTDPVVWRAIRQLLQQFSSEI